MHNDNTPYLRATADSASRSVPNGWADGRSGDFRFDPNAPLPPPPPLPGNHQPELRTRHVDKSAPMEQPLRARFEDDSRSGGGRAGEWAQAEAMRMTDTEKKLAELLATRDLLRSTGRRKAPDPGPLPDYMQL